MEFNVKKYIDFVDQTLDLDTESKRKTTWIIIRILNILMTIELAIFLAVKLGYEISIVPINFEVILLGFKNYDVIVGLTCFAIIYFGTRSLAWIIPSALSYTEYWSTWAIDNGYKEKLNKMLEDTKEYERWRVNYERRFKDAKVYTERLKLGLLFGTNLFLTYFFIVQRNLPSIYTDLIPPLLLLGLIIIGFLFSTFKSDLIWSIAFSDYFENKNEIKIEEIRKIDRYGLKLICWVTRLVCAAFILGVLLILSSQR